MHLRLPACCPLEQLTFSNYGAIFLDDDFSWTLIYNQLKQHLQDCNSTVAMENFQSILGTEWLADPVIFTMIDCLKRGMPLPDSETARTMDPPSALRGGHDANKHPRSIDLEQVCILDSVVSRKILIALQTGDYADVLRIFKHQCKFKTVKRILLPLNTSWEGITLGSGNHWMLAEMHLETDHIHLYDWVQQPEDKYIRVAGWAPSMCSPVHVTTHPTDAVSCIQFRCRPSFLSCTSAVWTSVSTHPFSTPTSAWRFPCTMRSPSKIVLTAACGHVTLCIIALCTARQNRTLPTFSTT